MIDPRFFSTDPSQAAAARAEFVARIEQFACDWTVGTLDGQTRDRDFETACVRIPDRAQLSFAPRVVDADSTGVVAIEAHDGLTRA